MGKAHLIKEPVHLFGRSLGEKVLNLSLYVLIVGVPLIWANQSLFIK